MIRIPSGVTDQYVYFVATLAGTAVTGLSSFTVYRTRNGAAASAMTTPTINEVDATNMPGLYELLLDEDMTLAAGNDSEHMVFYITEAGMDGAFVEIELYRPKITAGNTLTVSAAGYAEADMIRISGDVTAANNLESMYDGTGYIDATAPASRSQVDSIGASSGGSLNFEATSDNTSGAIKSITFVGSQTGTYANTDAEDGAYHQIDHATNDFDIVYGFSVGGARTAVEVTFKGYLSGGNDNAIIQAYDFVGTTWDTIATISGQAGTDNITITAALLNKHTGTGADLGNVYIRIDGEGDDSAPTLYVDQLIVAAVNVGQSVGYALGAVWLDTNASNTNTESFVDGVADNPVSTIAAALTIAGNVGLKVIQVAPGSSFTLAASVDNYRFSGSGYSVALGGQSCSGTVFENAVITGNDDGSNTTATTYFNCSMGTSTLGLHFLKQCGLGGTITLAEAGTYDWQFCSSQVAGTSTPSVDTGAAIANVNLNIRHYSGGIEIQNLGATGTDNCTVEGNGQVVLNANCTGGALAMRGNLRLVDNASGAVDITPTVPTIDQVHQGTAQAGTANSITLSASASSTNGYYDPGEIVIYAGTGAGQSRDCIDYNGTTKVAVVGKDWRTTPDSTSQYIVRTKSAALHVNEGMAQSGGANTIVLNTAASATDDIYIGQTVFLVGGTGQDQARVVIDYDGTTKTATVHRNWDINPTSTTSYVMVPLPTIGDSIVNIEADTGADGVAISAATANQIADAILNRDWSSVSDTNARTALNALRFLRNKYSITGNTLTVTKEDDSTTAWTSTLSSDAAADPVTGSDPA